METADTTSNFEFSAFQQWEIAFIYAFAVTFNPHQEIAPTFYRLPDFTPKELEAEIQREESHLIYQIICSCVGNILNRKSAIDTFKIALQQLVTDKMKTLDIDLESNPLSKATFPSLPTDVKLYLLHSMIEWQLQDSLAVKSIMDHYNSTTPRNEINPIKSYPIGVDSKKRNYWQFGESCWIWREKPHVKITCEWETVCRNKQDLEKLVNELSASNNRAEKALANKITNEIYELAEKEERKILRKERAELRKLIPIEVSITSTQLRSRGDRNQRVRYNYDDYEDDMYGIDEDEGDGEFEDENEEQQSITTRRSSRKATTVAPVERPTRWSNRLNNTQLVATEEIDVDTMNIDTQQNNVIDMDTTPSASEMMDTSISPNSTSNDSMDTRSNSIMDTSRSQSIVSNMDYSRPHSVMEQ